MTISEIEIEPLGFADQLLREADLGAEASDPAQAGSRSVFDVTPMDKIYR